MIRTKETSLAPWPALFVLTLVEIKFLSWQALFWIACYPRLAGCTCRVGHYYEADYIVVHIVILVLEQIGRCGRSLRYSCLSLIQPRFAIYRLLEDRFLQLELLIIQGGAN